MNLKWGFPTQNRNNQGVGNNNAGEQAYNNDIIPSIVREAIQNSLDAANPLEKAVNVDIAYGCIKKEITEYEDLFNAILSIREHMELCKERYVARNQKNIARVFQKRIDDIDRFNKLGRIPYLKIKDSGTLGMFHNSEKPEMGRLCTFIHEDGENNANNQNGGGANGIGKMAYFALSPLRMVLVSTYAIPESGKSEDGQSFFSGAVKLVTHNVPENDALQYQYAGYMPPIPENEVFRPLIGADVDKLPFLFSRRPCRGGNLELGSTIFIIGCEPDNLQGIKATEEYDRSFVEGSQRVYADMKEAILRNYWMSIFKNKLKVTLGTTDRQYQAIVLANDNGQLRDIMEACFGQPIIGGHGTITRYNPLPFILALGDDPDRNKSFELDLDQNVELTTKCSGKKWGKVRFYLYIDESLQRNLIMAMRSPLMTVCRHKPNNTAGTYAGVLVCDEEGNFCDELLRASEPHAHDKWEAAHVENKGFDRDIAKKLLDVIKDWIEGILGELFTQSSTDTGRFMGMSEILPFYNPEDASQRDSNLNKRNTALSGETSTIECKSRKRNESKGTKASYTKSESIEEDVNGNGGSGGGGNNGEGGNGPGVSEPSRKVTSNTNGKESLHVSEIPIKVRYFATQDKSSEWTYTILLTADVDGNITLRFKESGESASTGGVSLEFASEGVINPNNPTDLSKITIARNEQKSIKVKFKMKDRRFAFKIVSTLDNEE